MHRSPRTLLATALVAALALGATAGCSGDGDDDDAPTTTVAAPAASDPDDPAGADDPVDATTDDDAAPAELETTDLLQFLLEEDPEIGALFDWNAGNGVIAITYIGVPNVQLYTDADIDVETATRACELASDHVFPIDGEAAIEVLVGEYPQGIVAVSVQGADGTCTAA
jgi:hypothetical protein